MEKVSQVIEGARVLMNHGGKGWVQERYRALRTIDELGWWLRGRTDNFMITIYLPRPSKSYALPEPTKEQMEAAARQFSEFLGKIIIWNEQKKVFE